MSKFGFEPEASDDTQDTPKVSERLAAIPLAAPRPQISLSEFNAAAAPHGFVSREAAQTSGRRAAGVALPTRSPADTLRSAWQIGNMSALLPTPTNTN